MRLDHENPRAAITKRRNASLQNDGKLEQTLDGQLLRRLAFDLLTFRFQPNSPLVGTLFLVTLIVLSAQSICGHELIRQRSSPAARQQHTFDDDEETSKSTVIESALP